LARADDAPGITNAYETDEAADDHEPAGNADAKPESLERGLGRCDCDRRRFVWR
jgi:hypothetical protein